MSESDVDPVRVAAEALRLRLTDAVALRTADGRWRPLNETDASLLALLALRGAMARGELSNLLWPDASDAAARNNLRQRLHALERLAGRPLFERGDTLRLALAPRVAHDLGDPTEALDRDPEAGSPGLLGHFEFADRPRLAELIRRARDTRHCRFAEALARCAFAHESRQAIAAALTYARRLQALEPLSEHAARLLMRLHHRRGDRALALKVFDSLKHRLIDEMGETMAQETLDLAAHIGRNNAPAAAAVPALPMALRHPPRTVGREGLIAHADALRKGGSHVVLVGPAGAGKTRVLDELAQRWHIGVSISLQTGDEWQPHMLLRRLAHDIAPLLASEDGPVLPGEAGAVLHWLAGDPAAPPPRPLLGPEAALAVAAALDAACALGVGMIAIDNLQYADAEGVAELCQWLDSGGMRWLIACRDQELPRPLQQWLACAGRPIDPQIDLEPLSTEAVAEWLQSLQLPRIEPAAWAGALCRHCGGHPHSIMQILRELHRQGRLLQAQPPAELPVPQEVLRDIGRRLGRTDPLAQKLAFVAALAGREFDADLARSLLGGRSIDIAPVWHQLEAADILDGELFCHDLVHQAVAAAVPAPLVPGIHRDIADAMDRRGIAPSSRALHWLAAGEARRAGAAFAEAADQALAFGLQARARQWLLDAAAAYERAGLAEPAFDARRRAVMLTTATGSAVVAETDARDLPARARGAGERAAALCVLAEVVVERQVPEALECARAAGVLAARAGDPALTARARLREAVALHANGHDAAARERLDELKAHDPHPSADERQQAEATRLNTLDTLGRRE